MKRNRKNVQLILIDGSETCIASAKKLRHENDAQTLSKHVTILMDIMQCRHSSGRAGTGPHTSAKWSVECPNIPLSIYPASASIIYAYTSGGRIVSRNWHQFDITTHTHTPAGRTHLIDLFSLTIWMERMSRINALLNLIKWNVKFNSVELAFDLRALSECESFPHYNSSVVVWIAAYTRGNLRFACASIVTN